MNYTRRGLYRGITGRGFNSRRLHFGSHLRASQVAVFIGITEKLDSGPLPTLALEVP